MLAEVGEVPCFAMEHSQSEEQLGLALGIHVSRSPQPLVSRGSEKDWALGPEEGLGFLGAPWGLWMALLTQRSFTAWEKPFPAGTLGNHTLDSSVFPLFPTFTCPCLTHPPTPRSNVPSCRKPTSAPVLGTSSLP